MIREVNWDESLFLSNRLRQRVAIGKAPSYFEELLGTEFYNGIDDLDYYKGRMFMLRDGTMVALVRYRGNPEDSTTVFLPHDRPHIADAVHQILERFSLSEADIVWRDDSTSA